MATPYHKRLANSQLGIYFSIFASAFAALFLTLLILQQLGTSDVLVRISALVVLLLLFAAIGVGSYAHHRVDFFAAGRTVPSVYNGLVLAVAGIGGSGLIIIPGLLFINGFDAWCLPVGLVAGFVMMGAMIAPFYRKHGAYTLPSYLAWRFDSKIVRVAAAAVFAVPMLLLATAELKMAAYATGLLTGFSALHNSLMLCAVLGICLSFGGMRALSAVGPAQAIAVIIAIVAPAAMIGVIETNLPISQWSHGPVLRSVGRLEVAQQIPIPASLSMFAFDLAGQGPTYLKGQLTTPYYSLSPWSFAFTTIAVMLGIACAPWLLPTSGTTFGVYEARKSFGWTVFFVGFIIMTLATLAVFLRHDIMLDIVGKSPADLPGWFTAVASLGHAVAETTSETFVFSNIAFDRDGVLFAVPLAANLPPIVLYLILAGVICASLAASGVILYALSTILSEDILLGFDWKPISAVTRLISARLTCFLTIVTSMIVVTLVQTDPLQLMLWSLSMSAATAFPVMTLSIWWKKMNAQAALACIISGFATSVIVILSGDAAPVPLPTPISGLVGLVPAFVAAFVVTNLSQPHSQQMLKAIRSMRIPGGETIYDREQRLQRLKEQQRGK